MIIDKGFKLFSIQNFKSNLTTEMFWKSVVFYEEIGSSNNDTKRLAKEGKQEGLLVLAEKQTEGKGRFSRNGTPLKNRSLLFLNFAAFNPSFQNLFFDHFG